MACEQIEGSTAERWISTASADFVEGVDDAEAEAELCLGSGKQIGFLLSLRLRTVLQHCFGKIEDSYERRVEYVPSKFTLSQVDVAQYLANEVVCWKESSVHVLGREKMLERGNNLTFEHHGAFPLSRR